MTTAKWDLIHSWKNGLIAPFVWGPCSMSGELPDTVVITGNELKVLKVDEAVNTTFVCEVRNRIGTGKDQVTALVRGES